MPEVPGDALEFALRSADALAGTLNLRRTLGRIVDLAVSRFGTSASVTLLDDGGLRQVVASVGQRSVERLVSRPRVADDLVERMSRPSTLTASDVGLRDGAPLRIVPLDVSTAPGATRTAVLAVLGAGGSDAELDGLVRRSATAIANALFYDERATLAATLRGALVPAPLPRIDGVDLGASYRPALETTEIGGDFYEVVPAGDEWALSIGDVCGKGVEAAVLTGQARQSLRTAALVTDDPTRTLGLVNESLLATDGSNFVTIVHGRLRRDGELLRVRLASGGHPPPLLLRHGEVTAVPVRGSIVGMLRDVSFVGADVVLAPSDLLLMYTDGVTEARGRDGMLGVESVLDVLADSSGLVAQAVTERVLQLVLEHLDGRRHDDIAILALRSAVA